MTPKMEEVRDWILGNAKRDPVNCAGCTACCRGKQVVVLEEDWGDDHRMFLPEHLMITIYNGAKVLALKLRENGDCFFLRKGKCMIYDKRPMVCQGFDCRRATSSFTEEDREMAIKRKIFSREVFEAADARRHTMKMTRMEQGFYETSYKDAK